MIYDAIVLGAGPAGSTVARELARRGKQILLLDKNHFPRPKVCGGCLNLRALQTLERLGLGDLPAQLGGEPLQQIHLHAAGRSAAVPLPGGYSISRSAFDHALVDAAIKSGVEFRPGVAGTLGDVVDHTRIVRTSFGEFAAKTIILATGLGGLPTSIKPGSRIGAGTIVKNHNMHFPRNTITMCAAPGGYVGIAQVENHQLDIAAAFDANYIMDCGGLPAAADDVLRQSGYGPLPGATWKGTPALTRSPAEIAGQRWFAVGDAAGYVEPFTGEGMAWALAGAAELAGLAAQPWRPELISDWRRLHAARIRRRQYTCRILSSVLRRPRFCSAVVRILSFAPALARPVVAHLNAPVHA
jgi:menaquinone-9 beta-reductase